MTKCDGYTYSVGDNVNSTSDERHPRMETYRLRNISSCDRSKDGEVMLMTDDLL